jgi:hypothetical protein
MHGSMHASGTYSLVRNSSIIAAQAREPNSGLFVLPDSFTFAYRVEIVSLAARYRLPAVYAFRFFTALGGLLSYARRPHSTRKQLANMATLRARRPNEQGQLRLGRAPVAAGGKQHGRATRPPGRGG